MPPKCNYSAPPPLISPDNDITGIGVLVNYIATAGIAILGIIVYFLVVYEPAHDPFNKVEKTHVSGSFCPNLVDEALLRGLRRAFNRIGGDRRVDIRRKFRREKTFIKCMLAMSDLQLVTGLSVMISGFVQFHSGISTYHFVTIVYLAYFSTITHLSCLTVLRQYLHDHKMERGWRLLGMGILAILLLVGLVFTGNYDWAVNVYPDKRPNLGDYAFCYLDVLSGSVVTVLSMTASVCFIAIGFITRVIKLHEHLSRHLFGRARKWLSRLIRRPLRAMYSWLDIETSSMHSLRRTLCYRFFLPLLLMPRVLLDVWSSVSFEIGWLLTAFLWGVYRLLSVRPMAKQKGLFEDPADDDSSDWSYGQVVSVVLLAAPFITMIGYFNDDVAHERIELSALSSTPSNLQLIPAEPFSSSNEDIEDCRELAHGPDDPDGGWVGRKATHTAASVYVILALSVDVCFVLLGSLNSSIPTPLNAFIIWGPAAQYYVVEFALGLTGLYGVIIFSLMIETASTNWISIYRTLLYLLVISYFVLSSAVIFIHARTVRFLQPLAGAIYVIGAVVYRLKGSLKKK